MKRAWTGLVFGLILVASSVVRAETCADAARAASAVAQDYRNALGKMRVACANGSPDCAPRRSEAEQALNAVVAAHDAALAICVPAPNPNDDSLPATAQTVAAAIALLPDSMFILCTPFNAFGTSYACPDGSVITLTYSNVNIFATGPSSFGFSFGVNAQGAVPVSLGFGLGECTLTIASPGGIAVTGTATFSSSTIGGSVNRLGLAPVSINMANISISGCGSLPAIADIIVDVTSFINSEIVESISLAQFCGAPGEALFGPCP